MQFILDFQDISDYYASDFQVVTPNSQSPLTDIKNSKNAASIDTYFCAGCNLLATHCAGKDIICRREKFTHDQMFGKTRPLFSQR